MVSEVVAAMDNAANGQDLDALMAFYGDRFRHGDGLNREDFQSKLEKLWQDYPRLNYHTEILDQFQEGNYTVIHTQTHIEGRRFDGGHINNFKAHVESHQYLQNGQIMRQEILNETLELSTGQAPPVVKVILPTTVQLGQKFNFDVIAQDPLNGQLLLGGVSEEKVSPDGYDRQHDFDLTSLQSGGLFKIGEITEGAGDYWLSAILVGQEGVTIISQRLSVAE